MDQSRIKWQAVRVRTPPQVKEKKRGLEEETSGLARRPEYLSETRKFQRLRETLLRGESPIQKRNPTDRLTSAGLSTNACHTSCPHTVRMNNRVPPSANRSGFTPSACAEEGRARLGGVPCGRDHHRETIAAGEPDR